MRSLRITFMLFIISVMVSQSAMDFFSTILCLQWLYQVWKSKKTSNPLSLFHPMGLEKIWLTWFVVVCLGFALNWRDPAYAFERIIEFKWVLILYVLCQVFYQIKPNRESLHFLIPFVALIAGVNLFLYYANIDFLAPWRYGLGEMLRAGGFFANPMTFAHSFVILLSFLMGIALMDFKNWSLRQQGAMVILLLMSLLGLYLTFTRGVWIGFAFALPVGIFLWRPKYLILMALAGGFIFWALYTTAPVFKARVDRTNAEMHGESERKILWKAHFEIFKEHPILGAGYGQNTRELPAVYEKMGVPTKTLVSHAHNEYLHLAAGTGILGLLCYLSIWFFFVKRTYDVWKKLAKDSWDQGVALGLLIGQLAFLVGGFTEANFEHSKVRFMVMLAWAYVIYLVRKYTENTQRETGMRA